MTQDTYYTIRDIGHGQYEEKRSRFLAEAVPVHNTQEASNNLDRIRKQYYDARHHCSAYVIGNHKDIIKASDDGEPSGTAGLPILRVIEGLQCTDLIVVVTRYFGGTLLGTGGLTRAYTAAAKLAVENAGVICMQRGEILELHVDYGLLSSVQYYLGREAIEPVNMEYTDKVVCRIAVPAQKVSSVRSQMQFLSGGRMKVETVETGYYGF